VETSPLAQVDVTVPRGYVVTEDGSTAYELGVPGGVGVGGGSDFGIVDAIAGGSVGVGDVAKSMRDGMDGTTRTVVQAVAGVGSAGGGGGGDGSMLANLGTTTAIVLGGAMAFNLLSHHLTVNVFWV